MDGNQNLLPIVAHHTYFNEINNYSFIYIMDIVFQQRAEVAFRSLAPAEKKKITKAIDSIRTSDSKEALISPKLQKLVGLSPTKLYSYPANHRLNLIISITQDKWIVEDIIHHDRLNRLFSVQEQL